MNKPEKPVRLKTCVRCGRSLNTQTESWEMKTGEDGKYAVGIQHVTCPPKPEVSDLLEVSDLAPAPPPAPAAEAVPVSALPIFVTMDQAAEMIHVSKATIRRRIQSGELPAFRLRGGQTVLIDQKDVLALLEPIKPGTEI